MGSYELGMLRVFILIYETGSVTLASEQLFISQPSVSYTLRKLRKHFNDPLFQRRGNQLEPTTTAQSLYPKLRRLVGSLDDVMSGPTSFTPSTSTRRFQLRMTDVGVSGLLPPILHAVRKQAPQVTLDVETLDVTTVANELRTGRADAAICTTPLIEDDIARQVLFSEHYVGLCAAEHPRIFEEPTLQEYEDEDHVAVAPSTGHTSLDLRLRELKVHRRVVAVIPTFSALPHLLEGSDLISYVPSSVARRFIGRHAVRSFRLPVELLRTEVAVHTLKREIPSAYMEWFNNLLHECMQSRIDEALKSPGAAADSHVAHAGSPTSSQ